MKQATKKYTERTGTEDEHTPAETAHAETEHTVHEEDIPRRGYTSSAKAFLFLLMLAFVAVTVLFLDTVSGSVGRFISGVTIGNQEPVGRTAAYAVIKRTRTVSSSNFADHLFDDGYQITVFENTRAGTKSTGWHPVANYYKQGLWLFGW